MEKIASVYIATSLDGYIARKDGDIDWLNESSSMVPEGEDLGFSAFMSSIDTMIMGRKTFEQILSFGEWAYDETPVIILSRNPVNIPDHLKDTVSYTPDSPTQICERLKAVGAKRLYIDGGMTIQSFLRENLIKDITITRIPIALGEGIALFSSIDNDVKLKHRVTRVYDFGFVQSTYDIL